MVEYSDEKFRCPEGHVDYDLVEADFDRPYRTTKYKDGKEYILAEQILDAEVLSESDLEKIRKEKYPVETFVYFKKSDCVMFAAFPRTKAEELASCIEQFEGKEYFPLDKLKQFGVATASEAYLDRFDELYEGLDCRVVLSIEEKNGEEYINAVKVTDIYKDKSA